MHESIKILIEEHKKILELAGALEMECEKLKRGSSIDKRFFEEAISFIKNYADKFHHAKEEDILFKELCRDSVQENLHCNPVEQMLYEHNIGRNFVKGMADALIKEDSRKLVENSLGYVQLIREHIFKEDNILYPMADGIIDLKTQKIMLNKFKDVERSHKKYVEHALAFVNGINIKDVKNINC